MMFKFLHNKAILITVVCSIVCAVPPIVEFGSFLNAKTNFDWKTVEISLFCLIVLWVGYLSFVTITVNRLQRKNQLVYGEGSRFNQDIKELMEDQLSKHDINISSIRFNDVTTITDIVTVITKSIYSHKKSSALFEKILLAREAAFTAKYSKPKDNDEKILLRREKGDWETYFLEVCHRIGVDELNSVKVLDVGFGNGYAYGTVFKSLEELSVADISQEAISIARKSFKNLNPYFNSAEDLVEVPNNSINLYLSFRTYSSTLFDKRKACHEAFRVLCSGGKIIISLPILYIGKNGELVKGLGDSKKRVTMAYANQSIKRIKDYFEMLGFAELTIHRNSPYELFLSGKKP